MNFWSNDTAWFYISLTLGAILIFQAGMWYSEATTQAPAPAETPSEPTNNPSPDNSQRPPAPAPTNDSIEFAFLGSQYDDIQTHPADKALGNPDAPVTVTEYLDIECPFCQRLNRNAIPKLVEEYVKTGKVYYKIRHFPLGMHQRAIPAGNALECAVEQGVFWPLKYTLMHSKGLDYTDGQLIDAGRQSSIPDMDQYESCVTSLKYESTVQAEAQEGSDRGVSATPTLFINDEKIQGARPYSAIKQVIEKQL